MDLGVKTKRWEIRDKEEKKGRLGGTGGGDPELGEAQTVLSTPAAVRGLLPAPIRQ